MYVGVAGPLNPYASIFAIKGKFNNTYKYIYIYVYTTCVLLAASLPLPIIYIYGWTIVDGCGDAD